MGMVMKIRFTDVLREGTLKNFTVNSKVVGFQFDVRLGYYRGHYLSDVDELGVTVDGSQIPEQEITFCINGKTFAPSELKYLIAEFWNITTPATVMVHQPGGLVPGEHEIDLKLMLRSPYMPLPGGPGVRAYVPIDSCDNRRMQLSETGVNDEY